MDFSKMLAIVEKYMRAEKAYEVHDPPSSPIVKEWHLAPEFGSRKEDRGKGRQRS